ncbi:hypothetical protein [Acidihalobacter prosperus]|uniref:hypothetical protein n=1 Tax=Acidihalobacter prosperus TaxID=160660 RepID=UPI00050495FD|nr:hypothetical protein [Acidihalobacter prosperus]
MNDYAEEEDQELAEQQEKEFWQSVLACPHSARLVEIGNELNKVRKYANEHKIEDMLSQAIVNITLSAYYAGVSPLIRIEQTLSLAKGMNNEYAFALAARAYIEVSGRVHKGARLWRVFDKDRSQIDQFHKGSIRLLGSYVPEGKENYNIFKEKGFNVMSFVQSLSDDIAEIEKIYDSLSAYVHGGFLEQRYFRLQSWLAHAKGEADPTMDGYSQKLDQLREVTFSDFELLLALTRSLRERHDEKHEQE